MNEFMRFEGKTALITGSGRGIGRTIALKLASEGSEIVANFFRNRKRAEVTARGCEAPKKQGPGSCSTPALFLNAPCSARCDLGGGCERRRCVVGKQR